MPRISIRPWPAIIVIACLVFIGFWWNSKERAYQILAASVQERGRQVYISEGCIHCHSQYIRPHSRDIEIWGPLPTTKAKDASLLIGNRRQGPDLINVGNRRSAEWQRLHLIEPQSLSPGSRMPSYGHLFEENNESGDYLVAYLTSLGKDTHEQRQQFIQQWRPANTVAPVSTSEASSLFRQSCAQCHGSSGEGDGPVAKRLRIAPRNLVTGSFKYLPTNSGAEKMRSELERIVKFGISGTSMPGHEYLTDGEVRGLAEYVINLNATLMLKNGLTSPESEPSLLYRQNCAQCHGDTGHGDGILSKSLNPPPRDLVTEKFKYVHEETGLNQRKRELARIIRDGIPSTGMPAHRHLMDDQIDMLVTYIEELRQVDQ